MSCESRATIELVRSVPDEVYAGAPITLVARVRCSAGCRMSDAPLVLVDAAGVPVDAGRSAERGSDATSFVLQAPTRLGETVWTLTCPRHEGENGAHEASDSVEIRFSTVAHKASMAVWDVVSPVPVGNPLAVKIGVRCAACLAIGAWVHVLDEAGTRVGDGQLGPTPWTGTDGLYWTEVGLTGPSLEGLATYRAVLAVDALEMPHEPAEARFTFMTTSRPDSRVRVAVLDATSGTGLAGVEVHVGRYHLTTDAAGTASVDVPNGSYDVTIRRDGFSADPRRIDVMSAVSVRIEAVKVPTMAERAETLSSFENYPWG